MRLPALEYYSLRQRHNHLKTMAMLHILDILPLYDLKARVNFKILL